MKRGKSKTYKPLTEVSEECGVWLDPAELREKKKQRETHLILGFCHFHPSQQILTLSNTSGMSSDVLWNTEILQEVLQEKLVRPISKLLNPLARSGGYSVAVALNFTQTKMEMPATKQSTISSFFLPQSKKGRDAEDCGSLWTEMSSTPLPEAQTGTKRKREMFELPSNEDDINRHSSLIEPQEQDADPEGVSGKVCNDEENKEKQFFHLIWGYQSERESHQSFQSEWEPVEMKRHPENMKMENVADTQKDGSKAATRGCMTADCPEEIPESLLHKDQTQQYSHENSRIHGSICGDIRDGSVYTQKWLKEQSVTEKRAPILTSRSATEIQNPTNHPKLKSFKEPQLYEWRHQWSPVKREDKENSIPASPRHSTAPSPFKQRVHSSPAKRSSDFSRKRCRTPKKSTGEAQENDEDTFGMLFTQDSEGFQVIAHRSRQSRCPLKDQTNCQDGREFTSIPSIKALEMDEDSDQEPEMLFTQDSQGNMVIKH